MKSLEPVAKLLKESGGNKTNVTIKTKGKTYSTHGEEVMLLTPRTQEGILAWMNSGHALIHTVNSLEVTGESLVLPNSTVRYGYNPQNHHSTNLLATTSYYYSTPIPRPFLMFTPNVTFTP